MSNSAVEIEEKINALERSFNEEKQSLQLMLNELEYNLCSVGKEQITSKVSSELSNNTLNLVSAAKSNTLSDSIVSIVRPVVQLEIDELIRIELERFKRKLESNVTVSLEGIGVHLDIPPQEKEKFSLIAGTIAGGISIAMLNPIVGIFVGVFGGLLGKKRSNETERDHQIEQEIRGQIIPEATSQIIDMVAEHLNRVMKNFSEQLNITLEQKLRAHNEQLMSLNKQHKKQSDILEETKQKLTEALVYVSTLKQRIDKD
ncbi:hypothetical protein D5E71_03710 [Vibrio parahaemolyticus]|nr:hypothetical protein D5E71_03710 [Vibrio parahaemolyticus]